MRTTVNTLNQYFGDVLIYPLSTGTFSFNRIYPPFQVNYPFCFGSQTSCSCNSLSPCEQTWRFIGIPLVSSSSDIIFSGDFKFSWQIYENFNSISKSINSFLKINTIISGLIERVISVPIQLQLYSSFSDFQSNSATKSLFNTIWRQYFYLPKTSSNRKKSIYSYNWFFNNLFCC